MTKPSSEIAREIVKKHFYNVGRDLSKQIVSSGQLVEMISAAIENERKPWDKYINVGGYKISMSHFNKEAYWITGPQGDGMETSNEFEKLIAKFFEENM